MAAYMNMKGYYDSKREGSTPFANTLTPTLTGSVVMALTYEGGVAVASDQVAFTGHMARMHNNIRQYRLNEYCLVSFSGDFADFMWLQNVLERHQLELQRGDRRQLLKPKMVFSFLAATFYYRRSKINPVWNTIVVAGMQPVEFEADKRIPFIGVIDMRGIAYEATHVATEIGSMLLNQMLETRLKSATDGKLNKKDAIAVLTEAMKVSIARNCKSGKSFDISTIDAEKGVQFQEPVTLTGDWNLVDVCSGQHF